MNKMKTIYSQRLCGYLMINGFVLVSMDENKVYRGRNVFYFNDTPELERCIQKYLDSKSHRKG